MTFHAGQPVICVDDSGAELLLTEGQTYIVERIDQEFLVIQGVYGFSGLARLRGMLATRFRPVAEKQTDISSLTALLDLSPERV
jgi:hypothetical protein